MSRRARSATMPSTSDRPILDVTPNGPDLRLGLAGEWTLVRGVPSIERVARGIGEAQPRRLVFDAHDLTHWDSALVTFAYEVAELAGERRIDLDLGGLPAGARTLLALATAVPARPHNRPALDDALTARV